MNRGGSEPKTSVPSEDGASVCLVPSKYLQPFAPKLIDDVARSAKVFYKPDLEGTGENYLLVIQYPNDAEPTIVPVPRDEVDGFIVPFSKKPD